MRLHRERAARRFAEFDFLIRAGAERLADRLADMTGRFPLALELGTHGDGLRAAIDARAGIETLISADMAAGFAARAQRPAVVADEDVRAERAGDRGHSALEERTSRQLSQDDKQARADHVVHNDGSLEALRERMSGLLDTIGT